MGLFSKKPKLKNPQLVAAINHRPIKYVTSRNEEGVEYVLGRSGRINIKEPEIIVSCEGKDVFRCNIYEAEIGELLSRDGVRISGVNQDGEMVSVVAYYVYRR
ncbi:MAG: hypothetical protein IJF54_01900 [Clostridia bacterium]|nr:hypothetical protein [Clostridia bacterium]